VEWTKGKGVGRLMPSAKSKENKKRGKKGEPIGDNDDILLMSEGIWGWYGNSRKMNKRKMKLKEMNMPIGNND
jgi:hypothetical protein